jgi:hypothetical protein
VRREERKKRRKQKRNGVENVESEPLIVALQCFNASHFSSQSLGLKVCHLFSLCQLTLPFAELMKVYFY